MTATAPASMPQALIHLGGDTLPATLNQGVTHLQVEQHLGRPAQLVVTATVPHASEARAVVSDGAAIEVWVEGHEVELFSGTVTGIERRWYASGHQTVTVRAHDALHRLRGQRRVAAHAGRSAVEVAKAMVEAQGLAWQAHHASPGQATLHQSGETDLGFLRRVLTPAGLYLTARGGTVHLVDTGGTGEEIELRPGRELLELSIDERSAAGHDPAVVGWDAATVAAVSTGDADPSTGWSLDDATARRLSSALRAREQANHVVAHAIAVGDCRLRPATRIRLVGDEPGRPDRPLSDPARLVVSHATAGYVTELSTELTDPRPEPAPATVTLGRVVDVDDPQHRARVKVQLPARGGLVTGWMPVVCAGAGDDAGIVALPDVDASVAVLGPLDQPDRGIVLGGLFGDHAVPGPPVAGGRSRRTTLRLPGGAQVMLDDQASRLLVDNGDGSRLDLSPGTVTLHAAADLEISAPGRRLVIRADKIDFERA
jgi:phage baseplate assembly protein V